MSALENVLAIDAGQTGIKTRLRTADGVHDELFAGIRTHEALLPQLASVVHAVSARSATSIDVVAAGVSGLTTAEADAAALRRLLPGSAVARTILAHDSTTAFLGALGEQRGAVVAAGTGVVTLAVGGDTIARVDGWGHLIGDAGSGYWIGRAALDAVMRAYDGRGPHTTLRLDAEHRWPDLSEAYIRLQSTDDRVSTIASLSRIVAQRAAEGDAVARGIAERAAGELALSAATSLQRIHRDDDGTLMVCAIGGVFHSELIRHTFAQAIEAIDLDVALVEPAGEGIDGALALADLSPRHPLAEAVSVSVRVAA